MPNKSGKKDRKRENEMSRIRKKSSSTSRKGCQPNHKRDDHESEQMTVKNI